MVLEAKKRAEVARRGTYPAPPSLGAVQMLSLPLPQAESGARGRQSTPDSCLWGRVKAPQQPSLSTICTPYSLSRLDFTDRVLGFTNKETEAQRG